MFWNNLRIQSVRYSLPGFFPLLNDGSGVSLCSDHVFHLFICIHENPLLHWRKVRCTRFTVCVHAWIRRSCYNKRGLTFMRHVKLACEFKDCLVADSCRHPGCINPTSVQRLATDESCWSVAWFRQSCIYVKWAPSAGQACTLQDLKCQFVFLLPHFFNFKIWRKLGLQQTIIIIIDWSLSYFFKESMNWGKNAFLILIFSF